MWGETCSTIQRNQFMNRLLIATAALAFAASAAAAQTPAMESPAAPAAAAAAPAATAPSMAIAPHGDIAETLKASGQFTILVKALDATGLTPVLKSAGPLTVLAPTDAAFQALPAGELDDLMKPDNAAKLQGMLTYHVINAAVPPAKITGSKGPIPTVAGPTVQIDGTAAPIKVNDATVVAEAKVSNGQIYAVDKVLTPGAAAPSAGGH
jgi:uncharacterized surface protein with fasciclin (FAS1) repeats